MAGRRESTAGTGGSKAELRRRVAGRRGSVDPERRRELDAALLARLTGLVGGLAPGPEVFAYVPSGGEAGGSGLPSALADAGARVWLPVSPASGALSWARHTGDAGLRPGRFGIPVPDGRVHGPEVVGRADLILVPAVAVDRSGARLGRGGGYYDRTLVRAPVGARLLSPLDDEDVLDEVPVEPHDIRVHGVVTPTRLLRFAGWHSGE